MGFELSKRCTEARTPECAQKHTHGKIIQFIRSDCEGQSNRIPAKRKADCGGIQLYCSRQSYLWRIWPRLWRMQKIIQTTVRSGRGLSQQARTRTDTRRGTGPGDAFLFLFFTQAISQHREKFVGTVLCSKASETILVYLHVRPGKPQWDKKCFLSSDGGNIDFNYS